jgi:streptogramin lyase
MRPLAPIVLACFGLASIAAPAPAQFAPGDMYIACEPNHIQRVDPSTWSVSTFADSVDGLLYTGAVGFTPDGTSLLYCDWLADQVFSFDSAGNGTVIHDKSDGLVNPFGENGIAFAANGDLYISDFGGNKIVLFPAGGGAASTFADTSDGIGNPDGLAFAANGDLLVANRTKYNVLRIDPQGNATVFDTLSDDPFTIVVRDNGDVFAATFNNHEIYLYPGGDATQRTLFLTFSGNQGNPVLQFGPDQTKLYFSSHITGNLVEIDADTAAWTEVIPKGGLAGATSIAFAGNRHTASWTNYGTGLPGTQGVPFFTSQADPVLGTTITLDVGNSYGQPTSGLIALGFQKASLHTGLGSDLLLIPALLVPITFSYGSDSFAWSIPNDPALLGLEIDLQAVEVDPGAVKGVSFTQGLELVLGS